MRKKADTWMPLYVADYLADTLHLSTEQHGAYMLMLMAAWKADSELPGDDAALASIAKLSPARWRAHRDVLLAFFVSDGKRLLHKRVAHELARAKATSDARSKNGKGGAAKRWQNDGEPMANAIANAKQSDAPSPLPIPKETHAETSRRPHARAPDEADERGGTGPPAGGATRAGLACRAMRQAGLAAVNPGDPRLLALLAQGASDAELAGIAAEAVGKGKGFAWVLKVVEARRAEAAAIALAVVPPPATATANAVPSVAESAAWMAEQRAHLDEVRRQRARRLAERGAATA